ncbi:hypothetical protein [Nonomuraea diastatica]|uniref:Gram-positive cocci surface proteins LPxTG domain-containing protein n=1 Tax=Nonomuraea diastatica TaxID=1848329 RepID=A0A4R4WFA2_9ACTN|nr:hypothetical protein [Nonomuraea diastatica]TDD17639.1 hypothetical protein E1294_27165 [Nonomuraea diastatica]
MELEVLTSKARRRLALKTSAMAVLGAGIFGAIPMVAAMAAPVEVTYTCGPSGAPNTSVPFQMELKTPAGTITPNATVTVTWDVKQPAATERQLRATATITPNSTVGAVGAVSPSGSPLPSTSITASGAITQQAQTTVTPSATMPLPTMTMVVRPTATGTVALRGGAFNVQVNGTTWYECRPPTSGGPSVNLVVGTATGTPTNSPTTTPTKSPTPTPSSPRPTRTSTHTVTVTPSSESEPTRKSQTPKAGADTGAGGTMGPDGRLFILTGGALIVAAAGGGLLMRRRNAARG